MAVDGFSRATPLGALATSSSSAGMDAISVTWGEAFLGTIPGSMGETSALACLLGALVLVYCGIGSWRIMVSMLLGGAIPALATFMWSGAKPTRCSRCRRWWHLVVGGFAFGLVFMATDPVSAAMTDTGQMDLRGLDRRDDVS